LRVAAEGPADFRTVIRYANNNVLNGQPSDSHCPCRRLDVPDLYNCWRANFGVEASDFTLKDITTPDGGSQAEAFRGNGERILLANVNLKSYQDTLRLQGSGFVTNSYIEGDADFIWGVGTVFVQDSELRSTGNGYYCQIRNDAFVNTEMDRHIHPRGWRIQPDDTMPAPDVRFWEYGSTDLDGQPIDTTARHPASRQLTAEEAARWSDPAFVLGEWEPACGT
jgi:Pectinesterase